MWTEGGVRGGGEGGEGVSYEAEAGLKAGEKTNLSKPTYPSSVKACLWGTVQRGRNRGYDMFTESLWVC